MCGKNKPGIPTFYNRTKKTSVIDKSVKHTKRDQVLNKKDQLKEPNVCIGLIFGICLTITTILLHCIALSTPHWKEITSKTNSLYVDGVDALIRTEILHYFNSVHRHIRHSYGLFHRCEYSLNSSLINNHQVDFINTNLNRVAKTCTRNFLPTYPDDHFNECHSLPYYRFCAKANERNFDINTDYLHATFDISTKVINGDSKFSCDCHYPPYVSICQIVSVLAIIFLSITCVLFGSFPFLSDLHYRLKIKYFGMISALLSIIFLLINLIMIFEHFEYESIAYLVAIQQHYRSNQIYKLSDDSKIAIQRFLSTITIRMGYSTILEWIAFGLSIIDAIVLLMMSKINYNYIGKLVGTTHVLQETDTNRSPSEFTTASHDFQSISSPIPATNNLEEQIPLTQNIQDDKIQSPRILNEDEV